MFLFDVILLIVFSLLVLSNADSKKRTLKEQEVLNISEIPGLIKNPNFAFLSIPIPPKVSKESNETLTKGKKKGHHHHTILEELPEDLMGPPVQVEERQLGKSRVQQRPNNGTILGFKNYIVTLPWNKPALTTASTDKTTPSTGSTSVTSNGSTDSTTKTPDKLPDIDCILPKIPVPADNIYGRCNAGSEGSEQAKSGGATCFGYPDGCISEKNCLIATAVSRSATDPKWMKITLSATSPKGFIAVGFSEDRFMGDDIIAHCNQLPHIDYLTLHLSTSSDQYYSIIQRDMAKYKKNFRGIAGFAQDDGVISCEFEMNTRILMDMDKSKEKDGLGIKMADKSYHLFLSFGRHQQIIDDKHRYFGALSFHHLATSSDKKYEMSTILGKSQILEPRSLVLVYFHIIPFTLAFSFFLPCAIFMAKYGKEAFAYQQDWLKVHLIFQVISVILSLTGLICIIQEMGGVWRSTKWKCILHSVFGLLATIFLWGNFFLAVFGLSVRGRGLAMEKSGKPPHKKKYAYHYFKWAHWYIGNFVFCCGMAALALAHEMRRALVPCLFFFMVALQVLVHILTTVFMSFYTYWLVDQVDGKLKKRRVMPGPLKGWTEMDVLDKKKSKEKFHEMALWCGRRRSIIFYFITAALCCIGMIGIVFMPLVLCRQVYDGCTLC